MHACDVCGVAAHAQCLPKLAAAPAADCKRLALRPGKLAPPAPLLAAAAASSSWDHLGDAAALMRRASFADGAAGAGASPAHAPPAHRRSHSGAGPSSSPPPEPGGLRARDRGWARMAHHWVSAPEGWDEAGEDAGAPVSAKCLVCRTPCRGAALLAPEPLYRCVWCAAHAHGACVAAAVRAAAQPGKAAAADAAAASAAGARQWCTLGPYRHMIVPPVYVRELPRPEGSAGEPARAAAGLSWRDSQEIVSKAMQKAAQLRRRARRKLGKLQARSTDGAAGAGGGGSGGSSSATLADADAAADAADPAAAAAAAAPLRPPAACYELLRLPAEARPLLVFVNRRSGPQAGGTLLRRLRQALNPLQVWELPGEHGGPEAALALFARTPRLRIAVCGGDGTAGWVLAALDALWERQSLGPEVSKPPVAILPLGTGNDLARCLAWAASDGWGLEKGTPDVGRFLHDVDCSTVALLDRWSISIGSGNGNGNGGGASVRKLMNNYFSIGMDAKVALDFHSTREAHPDWFQSQAGNKLWYTGVAAGELLAHSCSGLPKILKIECDGVPLELPPDLEGVVILNIGSYMGGVDLWKSGLRGGRQRGARGAAATAAAAASDASSGSESDGGDGLVPQAMNDRLVEVVGHTGTWHLGKVQIGMSAALRLAQCARVRITTQAALPMQVDGEPWLQAAPCCLTIEHHSQALMLRRSRGEGDGAVMGVVSSVLDQAAAEGVIGAEQHRALVTEIARRLQ